MQKQEIFFIRGSQEHFLGQKHKSAIWDRTPPHLHIKPNLYVCRKVQGSQIFKQNWIISIHSRVIVILLIWVSWALGGGGCPGWSTIVYMSSEMFRGKESSNRIELSRLVQDLLNFAVLGSLRLWGWGGWVDGGVGWLGGAPHTHAHARTCMHGKHDNSMQMAAPIGFGEIPGIPYDVICSCTCVHVRACACVCTWVGCTPSPPPTPIHPSPHPQRGGPPESVKIQ